MYAVIKTGGHQYRVKEGDKLTIDRLEGEIGSALKLEQVLLVGKEGEEPTVGQPIVTTASVDAVIKEQNRAPKITVFKYKRRKNYKRKKGHKQEQTVIEIKKIKV